MMNTPNLSKNTTRLGERLFKLRGYTPLPFALLIVLKANPTKFSFLLGMIPVVSGELLRLWGVAYAGCETRSRKILGKRLITCGPFAYVRNPLYLGNILIYSGLAVMANVWMPYLLLAVWAFFFWQYTWIIWEEEALLAQCFGAEYRDYQQQVPRWIPRPPGRPADQYVDPDWKMALRSEKSTFMNLVIVLIILMVYAAGTNRT